MTVNNLLQPNSNEGAVLDKTIDTFKAMNDPAFFVSADLRVDKDSMREREEAKTISGYYY